MLSCYPLYLVGFAVPLSRYPSMDLVLTATRNATWHVHLMRECQDSAMKVRCPSCGYIADKLPPSLRCLKCDDFSHDWLIYDWESFVSMKRRHIRYNLFIIGITLINVLVALILKSTDALQWLFSLLFIPAAISLFYCRSNLEENRSTKGIELYFPGLSVLEDSKAGNKPYMDAPPHVMSNVSQTVRQNQGDQNKEIELFQANKSAPPFPHNRETRMFRLILLLIILWCIFIAGAMTLAPERVLNHIKRNRIWMWYMKTIFSYTSDSLNSKASARRVRIQGGIGLAAALLAQYAWLINPTSSP